MDCETISGFARVTISGHGAVSTTVTKNGFLPSIPAARRVGISEMHDHLSGTEQTTKFYGAVERFYSQFFISVPSTIFKSVRKMLTSMEETKRMLNEGKQFPFDDASAAASDGAGLRRSRRQPDGETRRACFLVISTSDESRCDAPWPGRPAIANDKMNDFL